MPRPRKPARLYQRPDSGDWIIRDGDRTLRTGAGAGEREKAERALADYIAQRLPDRAGPARLEEITVGEVLARYAEERGPQIAAPQTLAWSIRALAPFWGDQPVSAVIGSVCRRYVGQRGVAPATARRELGVLQAALNHAAREGLILVAPRVTLPASSPPRTRWLTRGEMRRLLRAAAPHVRRFAIIAALTGTRTDAVTRLRWGPSLSDPWVDLAGGIIHRKGAAEKETKKGRGPVRMPEKLARLMRRWSRDGAAYVIHEDGHPVASVRRGFTGAVKRAKLAGVTRHTLKHTAVTWAFQRGMSIEDAAEYFATSAATLQRVYRQHAPEYQSRAARVMDRRG